jgi:hypothetical protein
VAVMCSHYYVVYPQFEVAEDDENEGALRCAVRMSSGRDLVEEFVGYGVWPLVHGWALGEVCPRQMPSRGGMLGRSPAFTLDLHGRDPAAFVREAEDGAARIVGRYVPKTKGLRRWDIRGSNDRLNRVFELNRLSYGCYPLGRGRRHVYVSYSSWLEDFPLRTKHCCCCVGSDEQGPPGCCVEASGGRQAPRS